MPSVENFNPDVPMARWLTFDRKTASTLRKQLPREQVFEHGSRNAVEYASGANQNLVTLLPTGSSGEVAIAVFRQPAAGKSSATPAPRPVLVEKHAPAAQAAPPQPAPSAWKVVASPSTPSPATPSPKVETPASPRQNEPLQKPEVNLPFVRQKAPMHRVGGILGTRDEIVFEDEEPVVKPKRNWWQRFWDEDE
jgi:hypothetical protein